jgi:hypothetical protein
MAVIPVAMAAAILAPMVLRLVMLPRRLQPHNQPHRPSSK